MLFCRKTQINRNGLWGKLRQNVKPPLWYHHASGASIAGIVAKTFSSKQCYERGKWCAIACLDHVSKKVVAFLQCQDTFVYSQHEDTKRARDWHLELHGKPACVPVICEDAMSFGSRHCQARSLTTAEMDAQLTI